MGHTKIHHPTMRHAYLILVGVLARALATSQIDKKDAQSGFLRVKRANQWAEETRKSSNLERECVEEICSVEEYVEQAENEIGRKKALMLNKDKFQSHYRECMTIVNKNRLNDPKKIDL